MKKNVCLFIALFSLFSIGISFAQSGLPLLRDGMNVLFVGNENVGTEGGVEKHFRRMAASASLAVQTDWIAMYDKPTLGDMYTDALVERIRTGNDSLFIVSGGSEEAMRKFARLAGEVNKQMVFFETWPGSLSADSAGMAVFREQTVANTARMKRFEEETGIPVVPVGLIFYDLTVDPVSFFDLREDYLFTPGRTVQNDLGILANIAAIYAVTTGRSPVGLPFWDPYPENLVKAIQERAWTIVQNWQTGKMEIKPIPDKYAGAKWPALIKNDDHILYVGNSYIGAEGGLDNHFKRMVREMDPPLTVYNKSMIHWGRGLEYMYNDSVLKEIGTKKYDLVVVTGGTVDQLGKFKGQIDKAGSKMMVHMTWAMNPTLRKNDLNAYREEIAGMVGRMKEFEKKSGVPVAPCGLVFYDLIVDPPAVPGLRPDWPYMVEDIHQNHIGTMANAATHYAVMTGRSPVGLRMWDPYPAELVKAVQERAWQIVQDWKAGKTVIKQVPEGKVLENRKVTTSMERRKKEIKWVNPPTNMMEGLSHHVLQSKALGHDVGYSVWLPAEYSKKVKKRYPVLYFLHGMGGNESADAASFSGLVLKAIEKGILPPVICVFPNGGVSFYRGEVENMIIDELIPAIDRGYRTIAKAQSRALAGFSMGGFGSVYLSVMHPELFCAAGSMGGALWNMDSAFWQAAGKAIPVWSRNNCGFFFVNGDSDEPEAFKEFSEVLTKNGIDNQVVVLPDTGHNLGKYYEESSDRLFSLFKKHIKTKL